MEVMVVVVMALGVNQVSGHKAAIVDSPRPAKIGVMVSRMVGMVVAVAVQLVQGGLS
jgi:hypothetical protein